MEREAVESSMIASVGYDAQAEVLEIEFPSGEVYDYHEVPQEVYEELMEADSKGRYFLHSIRGVYGYKHRGRRSTRR